MYILHQEGATCLLWLEMGKRSGVVAIHTLGIFKQTHTEKVKNIAVNVNEVNLCKTEKGRGFRSCAGEAGQKTIFIIKFYHVLLAIIIPFNKLHAPATNPPNILLPEVIYKGSQIQNKGSQSHKTMALLQQQGFLAFVFFFLIDFRDRERERERENTDLLLYLLMHSLVDSCMCPDQGQNPQPWCTRTAL